MLHLIYLFFSFPSEESPTAKIRRHKTKKSKSKAGSSKQSKKSSRKKKKKKKKSEGEKCKKAESSSSGDDSGATKDRQRMKKRKSKNHKYPEIRIDEESSLEDNSDVEKEKGGRTSNHKKRKQASHRDSDSGLNVKKRRRNWKAADEESSRDSSADWDSPAREITNAACVCRNFRRPSSAGLFCLCLKSTKPKQLFCICVQTPLQMLEAARAADGGFWQILSHSSWGILSGGASLIPSTLSISLTKRLLYFWDNVFINKRNLATFS